MPSSSASQIAKQVETKSADFWAQLRERNALKLFHAAANRVPAYKDFLKKNHLEPNKIKTFNDFQLVPQISKKEYLRKYPLEKLCWEGTLQKPLVFTSTSGSTGAPFYFPRGRHLDWQYSILARLFLENSTRPKGPTLVIIGFGMGIWIGGLITYKAFEIASQETRQSVSVITPGINKEEIFHALKQLSPHYLETILIGYPPFLKDIVDEAPDQGINLKKLNLRIFSAAEAYTEKFRDYLAKRILPKNIYRDFLNIYGTADIGAMAWETPTTILIRRLATKNKALFKGIFGHTQKTPTLAQYNPHFLTFEAPEGNILLTGNNTIPLIRYAVGDHGGILSYQEMLAKLNQAELRLPHEAKKAGIEYLYQLPFVFVYERSDFSTKLYGAIIYPEPIRDTLQSNQKLQKFFTGRFAMLTKFDKKENQFLEINVELKPEIKPSNHLRVLAQHEITKALLKQNAEFRNNHQSIPHKVTPHIVLWENQHPQFFKAGIKQKWVVKPAAA